MADSTKKKSDKKKMTTKQKLTAVANITGSLAAISRGQSYSWDDSGDEAKKMSFGQEPTENAAGKGVKPAPVVSQDHTNLKGQTIDPYKDNLTNTTST